jgi:hypothetical protein
VPFLSISPLLSLLSQLSLALPPLQRQGDPATPAAPRPSADPSRTEAIRRSF